MKIPAGQFKAKCLQIMDEVEASGEAVTITKLKGGSIFRSRV